MSALVDSALDRDVLAFLDATKPQCHSDVALELLRAAEAKCGEWSNYQPSGFSPVVLVTARRVFALAYDQSCVCLRLDPPRYQIALRTGGDAATTIGPEWVAFQLLRDGWPTPDLPFWTLRAYVYARHNPGAEPALSAQA